MYFYDTGLGPLLPVYIVRESCPYFWVAIPPSSLIHVLIPMVSFMLSFGQFLKMILVLLH